MISSSLSCCYHDSYYQNHESKVMRLYPLNCCVRDLLVISFVSAFLFLSVRNTNCSHFHRGLVVTHLISLRGFGTMIDQSTALSLFSIDVCWTLWRWNSKGKQLSSNCLSKTATYECLVFSRWKWRSERIPTTKHGRLEKVWIWPFCNYRYRQVPSREKEGQQ